jgi:hypothetical protein
MCYSAGIMYRRVLHSNSVDLRDILAKGFISTVPMRPSMSTLEPGATRRGGYCV